MKQQQLYICRERERDSLFLVSKKNSATSLKHVLEFFRIFPPKSLYQLEILSFHQKKIYDAQKKTRSTFFSFVMVNKYISTSPKREKRT
jgi:uncharacterized protein YeeX (DUF496 family)